jgi:hypothetical protein
MTDNMRYAKFDNNILSDVFGEEVVLVNLDSGMYYSLRGSATQIWIRLFNQYSLIEILADLIQIYQVTENQLNADINLFVTQLLELKIIKTATDAERKEIDFISKDVLIDYSTPVVEIFSDMQEILLLDPVHDVDKSGWPISRNSDNPPS